MAVNPNVKRLFGPVDPAHVIPLVGEDGVHFVVGGYRPKVSSLRLRCFARDAWVKGESFVVACSTCGILGDRFFVEQYETERPHLNLYATDADGEEVLMTRDHVVPLSRGGPDTLENLISMCIHCNEKKGNTV